MNNLKLIGLITSLLLSGASSLSQSRQAALRPSAKCWDYAKPHVTLHVSRVSRNRRLASVCDTLYMLDNQNRIVWKWSSDGPPFTDLPIIDSTGTIYVIGYDLLWAAIDSATGKEKWRKTVNGRAAFTQIKPYRRDMYLVVTDMWGYRDSLRDKTIEDWLQLCKGNAVLWETDIPATARIEVSGNKVFVVYKHKQRFVRRPVVLPNHFGKPMGK
ncbi:MAG TPA: hypothetical protein VHE60_08645 [Pyrinomonadaceae bacterium]|nr:hypothetical protein [Pyrinomonadaceae bacterium]